MRMLAGDVAVFLSPFRVKTSLEIPQGEAGRFSKEGTLRLGAERDVVDVAFRNHIVGHLTEPVAKQVLPLLQSPGLVEFSIGCWREVGGTADKVEVVITPLLSNSEMDQRQATTVRKLRAISCRTEFQLNNEYGRRMARQKIAAAKLPVDVLGNIIGRMEWRDVFGSVRLVAPAWRDVADRVAPVHSCRWRVSRGLVKTSRAARAALPELHPSSQASVSLAPTLSQLSTQSQLPPPSPEKFSQAERSAVTDGKLRFPPLEWFERSNFNKRGAEEIMARLENRVGVLEAIAEKEERELIKNGGGIEHAGEGDGNEAGDPFTDEAERVQWRRVRSHLRAVREVAATADLLRGDPQRTALQQMRPQRVRTSVFGVVTIAAGAGETYEDVTSDPTAVAVEGSTASSYCESRWNGWKVFSLAILLASSEDRPFLCRSALQSLGDEAVGDTAGLPKPQLLELLCWYYLSLQPPKKEKDRDEPTGFQTASSVSIERTWGGQGSFRLRADLLSCICAVEKFMFSAQAPCGDKSEACLTPEQQAVVETNVRAGEVLKVVAFAGTGKTTCLREWAARRPHLRILYAAFNRTVCEEAQRHFSRHVQCRTMNSMAWQHAGGSRYQAHGSGNLTCSVLQLKKFLENNHPRPNGHSQYVDARVVLDTLNKYWNSKDDEMTENHVKHMNPPPKIPPSDEWVLRGAQLAWARMKVVPKNLPSTQRLQMTHSGLLKMFQLTQKCQPTLRRYYDVIMLDEAQDSNDCIADIVLRQTDNGCGVILVGDPHQMIYSFRGARDHITRTLSTKTLNLTQVFRFGPSIASVANTTIGILKGEKLPLLGSLAYPKRGPPEDRGSHAPACSWRVHQKRGNLARQRFSGFVASHPSRFWAYWNSTLASAPGRLQVLHGRDRKKWLEQDAGAKGRYAYLASTNASLLIEAMEAMARGEDIAFVGGMESVKMKEVEDLCAMIAGNGSHRISDPRLKEIGSITNLRRLIGESGEDSDLQTYESKLNMIDRMMESGTTLQEIVSRVISIKRLAKPVDHPGPLMMLSTVHKAKGTEFDTVVLADDFRNGSLSKGESWKYHLREKANQLYVGITRARRRLLLNGTLAKQLCELQMWDSLSLRGDWSEPALLGGPETCFMCPSEEDHAQNPQGNPQGNAQDDSDRLRQFFLFKGSGSKKPICLACAGGGAFAYVSELLPTTSGA